MSRRNEKTILKYAHINTAGKPIGETKYIGKTALHNPEVKFK